MMVRPAPAPGSTTLGTDRGDEQASLATAPQLSGVQYDTTVRIASEGFVRLGYMIPDAWTPRHYERKLTAGFLNRFVCCLPNLLDTQGQYEQYIHADLQRMTPQELHRELGRVRLRLLLEEPPQSWLCDRVTAIRDALGAQRTQQ